MIKIIANIVEINFYFKKSFNKYMYKSNFTYVIFANYLSMIGLMFPLSDPLKHIHSAIVLTPLQLMVQDWTYFKRIMLQY